MPNTTRITASYKRTVKTAEYFSATVENGFDEEVTYNTEEELIARRAELRELAMSQLLEDLELLLAKLGAGEKRVFVKNSNNQSNSTVVGSALD